MTAETVSVFWVVEHQLLVGEKMSLPHVQVSKGVHAKLVKMCEITNPLSTFGLVATPESIVEDLVNQEHESFVAGSSRLLSYIHFGFRRPENGGCK